MGRTRLRDLASLSVLGFMAACGSPPPAIPSPTATPAVGIEATSLSSIGCGTIDLRGPDGRPVNLTGLWGEVTSGFPSTVVRQLGDCYFERSFGASIAIGRIRADFTVDVENTGDIMVPPYELSIAFDAAGDPILVWSDVGITSVRFTSATEFDAPSPLALGTITVGRGDLAGTYAVDILRGGCFRWEEALDPTGPWFGFGSWTVTPDGPVSGIGLRADSSATADGGTTEGFDLQISFRDHADTLSWSNQGTPDPFGGTGHVHVDDRGATATITVEALSDQGVDVHIVVECSAVREYPR